VLLHGYANSLHWFDAIEPLLAENHRVIRIDLLGFGGSEKPESGYSIPEQAAAVAEALSELEVQGALVAGHSMGGAVMTSLAEQASQLVDRAVMIDMAPDTENFGDGLPFLARLGYTPVIGEAMWRVTPDFAIEDGFKEAFAPGFDSEEAFENPDQIVDDFRSMTYTSYDAAPAENEDYTEELPLDERFKRTPVPLLVIFGQEDQLFDAAESIEGYEDVPGVQTEVVEDAGHAPQVEKPEEVAELLEAFSVPPEIKRVRTKPPRKGQHKPGSDPKNQKQKKDKAN
jgi:pimeloyl-ACP methyl ester carboxylesterase